VKDGPAEMDESVAALLEMQEWHGNLRELKNVMIASYLRGRGSAIVTVSHLPPSLKALRYDPRGDSSDNARIIEVALQQSGYHVGKAADLIGVHRNTVGAYLAGRRNGRRKRNGNGPVGEASDPTS
jgi:transcriptional regulator of acetoin/glycerol metabolism